ncbi:MAG: AAA family ATPase [Bradymonadia bacterium]
MRTHPIFNLPIDVSVEDAVEAACAEDITFIERRLRRRDSVLVECDKELALYLYLSVRQRMRKDKSAPKLVLIDGRPKSEEDELRGNLANMMVHLTNAIRGSVDRRVLVMPHLDVLTTTHTGLTMEAREVIPLLYENPETQILAFRDPSFDIPKVIEGVFDVRREVVGIPREALPRIVTQREAKALDADRFDPFALYTYLSGQNPVRCRKLLAPLADRREAMPGHGKRAARAVYRTIREATAEAGEDMALPDVDLHADVGGYDEVKARLSEDLIGLVHRRDALTEPADIQALEKLLPRGIIFHGPPGTGKTHFAKALATALDATAIIVSGPELKSQWVGASEANLRRVFRRARASAPAIVVFDEIDAFAHARGTYSGSGVEHSMVNQLLTEMDGFRKNEMVFVVGTTNFLSSLDGALLRPGRFEFLIEIPAPDPHDRAAIVSIYDQKLSLGLSDTQRAHIVRRTEGYADRQQGIPFTGDHIYAVCRALKRQQLRTGAQAVTMEDIDQALERRTRRPLTLGAAEERTVAVHEAGHALLSMLIEGATPPERISITPDAQGALGYVLQAARARPYTMTADDMRAEICVGLGGRAAEQIVNGAASIGAYADLKQATEIARAMVEDYGMSPLGPMARPEPSPRQPDPHSEWRRRQIDEAIAAILDAEAERAEQVLRAHLPLHTALVDRLLAEKVIEGGTLSTFVQIKIDPNEVEGETDG